MRSREMSEEEKREYERLTKNCFQMELPGTAYGYARISTPKQSIDRQIRNIKQAYPDAYIFKEAYTGTTMVRPEWDKLMKMVRSGDLIIFDSVSRMSRSADEGIETYMILYNMGVNLVFLKERHIDTESYKEAMDQANIDIQIEKDASAEGTLLGDIIKALNKFMQAKVRADIEKAFEQAEKEVQDLRCRTKEGIMTARANGKQIGQKPGSVLTVKKKAPALEKILKYSKSFNGTLPDADVIKLIGINRNTYYKYKRELKSN